MVTGAELFKGPVGNVLAPVAEVFGIGVEGEALEGGPPTKTRYTCDRCAEISICAGQYYPQSTVLCLALVSGTSMKQIDFFVQKPIEEEKVDMNGL